MVIRKKATNVVEEMWECGMCHIKTFGEWDAEARPKESEDENEWMPLCKACSNDVRKDFIPDEEDDTSVS